MTRRFTRVWRSAVVLSLLGSSLQVAVLSQRSASAHGGFGALVAPSDPSRPPPVVDGVCERDLEYAGGWRSPILYGPRMSWRGAEVLLFQTDRDLYVCIGPMPLLGLPRPTASVLFDMDHDGGPVPDPGDRRFTVNVDGFSQAWRGSYGAGFRPDLFITGWDAAASGFALVAWKAEFRFPLTLLGVFPPGTIGFSAGQESVRSEGDDFAWPPRSFRTTPETWADLFFFSSVDPSAIRVDASRITQGAERDLSARVEYDLIAGKTALIRARLFRRGTQPLVSGASCTLQRIAPAPAGPETTVPAFGVPRLAVNRFPTDLFDGTPFVSCVLPGHLVGESGIYRFGLTLSLDGEPTQTVDLGTRLFLPSADLRLFLWPWENSQTGAPNPRAWGADLTAKVFPAMRQLHRMYPLAVGVSAMPPSGIRHGGGLRYYLYPSIGSCDDSLPVGCAPLRAQADDALQRLNAWLRLLEIRTGVPRDRMDWGSLLEALTTVAGFRFLGQSCWGAQKVAGVLFDTSDVMGSLLTQEIAHCMGLVSAASPNNDGGAHSRNPTIPTPPGFRVINMLTRTDIPIASSVMFSAGDSTRYFLEGWEWNDLRNQLLSMPRPLGALRAEDEALAMESFFHAIATVASAKPPPDSGEARVLYSQRVEGLPLEPMPDDPNGSHELLFLDGQGKRLGGLHFEPDFLVTHGDPLSSVSVVLTTELPEGATRAEIRTGDAVLWATDFSTEPPVVTDVVAEDSGQGGIDVQWTAADPDSDALTFNVFFQSSPEDVPLLVASGLIEDRYFFRTDLAPATKDGRLLVEASDGLNTAQGESQAFTISDRPPIPYIAAPGSADKLIAGQRILLLGGAHDFTTGSIAGESLSWSSDILGALGTGEELEVTLPSGKHTLTLTAKAQSGLSASASIEVDVQADSDGDAITDQDEAAFGCLSAEQFDSDFDHDGDLLASLAEFDYGTDPCEPDTDLDAIGDGDEVRVDSDPTDPDGDGDGVLDGFDNCLVDANQEQSDLDGDGSGDACDPEFTVVVDIKPGTHPNSVKPGGKGVIGLAILSIGSFDATKIDFASVCFGDAGSPNERDCTESHGRGHIVDADGDGVADLVLHYETRETGIDAGDTQACLTGRTSAGVVFGGCDSIETS